eukprot:2669939-Pyramimonas_sp.AAC.1
MVVYWESAPSCHLIRPRVVGVARFAHREWAVPGGRREVCHLHSPDWSARRGYAPCLHPIGSPSCRQPASAPPRWAASAAPSPPGPPLGTSRGWS